MTLIDVALDFESSNFDLFPSLFLKPCHFTCRPNR